MAVINGNCEFRIQPIPSLTNIASYAFYPHRQNLLKSVNDQLRYQVVWINGTMTEAQEPSAANYDASSASGDIVNVLFNVTVRTDRFGSFRSIGKIKKSRDIVNKKYDDPSTPAIGHRFTVDISQMVADELSYSLCPIGKGSWRGTNTISGSTNGGVYGGMNGGLTIQDNTVSNNGSGYAYVSDFNIAENGTFREVRIEATFEVIRNDGKIVTATNSALNTNIVTAINSVNQVEEDSSFYFDTYCMLDSATTKYAFLSRCKNFSADATIPNKKEVRMDEEAEFLQFYLHNSNSDDIRSGVDSFVGTIGLKVETFLSNGSAQNTFYLRDFEDLLYTTIDGGYVRLVQEQKRMLIQNVSPSYINNSTTLKASKKAPTTNPTNWPYWNNYTGNKIESTTAYYRVSVSRFAQWSPYTERRTSEYRYYVIDRESEKIPYGFVRFHWLNSLGGIDSYTAKKDVAEGLSISRDVIERKGGDRTWYQTGFQYGTSTQISDLDIYHNDTMRGGDIYKGGREVTNVNANKNQSVYTNPLNKIEAKWLQEIMTSPNVWIEMDTDSTAMGNANNPYLRPSTKEYIPVIINNGDIETVNQEAGLVRFNIEYTLAHKVITQRN